MNPWKWLLLLSVLAAVHVGGAAAGELSTEPDGSASWQAGVDGVEIEWNPDHSVKRIYSMVEQPVEFPDRRGIAKAETIAEEKAKAAIVRFMKQDVSSARLVTEVQNDLEKATRTRADAAPDSVSKVNERAMIENLTEVTGSFASGELQGVIVLERGYDEKREMAWTKVGISQKTIAAARALREMPASTPPALTQRAQPTIPGTGPGGDARTGLSRPGSELRKSRQNDW